MKKHFFLVFLFASFLMSCGQPSRLTKKDYGWMPYKGNETLVFRSNIGETDTIFLLKKDTLMAYPEAQAFNGIKYEVLSTFCRHSDPSMPGDNHRYLENEFFKIERGKDNCSKLKVFLASRDANFYRANFIRIDSLDKATPSILQTKGFQYNDVYVISAEDYLGSFYQRSNFVTKVYWSKSQGLVRYDKKDDVYWELEKKY